MKIKVELPFPLPDGKLANPGDIIDLPDNQAQAAITNKFASKYSEAVPKATTQPLFKHRIGVSQTRHFDLIIWPPYPGARYNTPNIVLSDERSKDGNWSQEGRVYLSQGTLLELSEVLREIWRRLRDQT